MVVCRLMPPTNSLNPTKQAGQRGCLLPDFPANFGRMRRYSNRVVALALAAGVVLSACSSTDRMAAPSDEEVMSSTDESVPVSDDSLEPSKGLFNKSTRVCIRHEANLPSGSVDIKFTHADTSDSGWLVPNGERKKRCAEGRERHGDKGGGWDVKGTLEFPFFGTYNAGEYLFMASNPEIGSPTLQVNMTGPVKSYCSIKEGFSVGEKSTFDDALFHYTIERLPDSNWKEFEITIRDSLSPSSDGKVRICR